MFICNEDDLIISPDEESCPDCGESDYLMDFKEEQ
jgi:RNA polymerase subunit RPABC4/transcription elongation factor Spt4